MPCIFYQYHIPLAASIPPEVLPNYPSSVHDEGEVLITTAYCWHGAFYHSNRLEMLASGFIFSVVVLCFIIGWMVGGGTTDSSFL